MNYALYPGCALHGTSRDYGASLKAACARMDIGLEEIPGWLCCGATAAHMTSDLLAVALPAANLAKAEAMGLDVLLPCAACYNRLAVARERMLTEPDTKARAEEATCASVTGASKTLHPLNVFARDAVRERVKRPLQGLSAVAYYGCVLTRPASVSVDPNIVNPTIMDGLMEACGVQMLPWPFKTECCGATMTITRPKVAARLGARLLEAAQAVGAQCVITACPLCQSNLDVHQARVETTLGRKIDMPIVFFTEILALALGTEPDELELDRHIVDAVHLIAAAR